MTEPKGTYVTRPILLEKLAAQLDDEVIERLLYCLSAIQHDTNFGCIELRISAGKVDEVKATTSWKMYRKSVYNIDNVRSKPAD